MQWSPLARRECRTVLTSKGAWILTALIVLWGFRPTYTGWNAIGQNLTIGYIQTGVNVLLPIGVLLLTYQSLIGERTTGSIKFLIALPLKRTHIILGKTVGRFAGLAATVGVAVLLLTSIGVFEHGAFAIRPFIGVVLATVLLLAALVSLGVLLSTAVKSTVSAAGIVVGYILVTLFWNMVVSKVYTVVTGVPVNPYDAPASGPLFFALRLTPDGAYNVLTNWILGVGNSADQFQAVYTKLKPGHGINAFVVEAAFESGTAPWYLHPALSIGILAGWIAVPLVLSRRIFDTGDVL